MRTGQRDQGGITTFTGRVQDAASGSSVAQPGSVPFTFVRNGTGSYTVNFDGALVPLFVTASGVNLSVVRSPSGGAGFVNLLTEAPANTSASGTFVFTVTARDSRR